MKPKDAPKIKQFILTFTKIVFPFFKSEARKQAWTFLGALVLLLFLVSAVNVMISYIGRDFITALSDRNSERFYALVYWYIGAFALATLIAVLYRYIEERMALKWRDWMTQHLLKKYFFARTYYSLRQRQEIDNPDQRIAEDIKNFTATSLSLLLIFLNSIITVVAFIGVLATISGQLVVVLLAYSFIGTILAAWIGRSLVHLHFRQYIREANFRYSLIRVRDNAESIAFYRGEPRERLDLLQRFRRVYGNTLKLIGWNRNLAFFTTGYNYIALIIPTLVVAPLYLSRQVEFGVVTQTMGAFAQVLAALTIVISQFERLSAYAAGVVRLETLWDALNAKNLQEGEDDPEIEVEEGKSLKIKNLTVMPPGGRRKLVQDLNLSLPNGKGLLVMGASGAGKSSILRTIAGLWNSGEGKISRPRLKEMMFLPQRPYMPVGSLRSQLVYPQRKEVGDDAQLKEILKLVNLESLLERSSGNLDEVLDWANILSLGEQQRVSFARMLFQKPKLAFLDESTSALDEENEKMLYKHLIESKITFVSVGHRSSLRKFHDNLLTLEIGGKWNLDDLSAERAA